MISRRCHAKDDEEAIVTWSLELKRIRRVFDVRFVTPVRPPLTARFKTELEIDTRATGSEAINKHAAVSGVRHDSNTQPTVSGVQSDAASTRTTPSDIRRSELKGREGTDGQNRVVSTTHTLSPSKH